MHGMITKIIATPAREDNDSTTQRFALFVVMRTLVVAHYTTLL